MNKNMTMNEAISALKKLDVINRLYEKVVARRDRDSINFELGLCKLRHNLIAEIEESFGNELRVVFDTDTNEPILVSNIA